MNQALDVRVHRAMVEAIRRIDRDKVLHKLNELAKEVIECQKCQLGANRARAIPGVGPAHARILQVSFSDKTQEPQLWQTDNTLANCVGWGATFLQAGCPARFCGGSHAF